VRRGSAPFRKHPSPDIADPNQGDKLITGASETLALIDVRVVDHVS